MYKFLKNYGFGVILSSALYKYITTVKHRYSLDIPSINPRSNGTFLGKIYRR